MKLTGAQALMRVLKDEGVDTIFGFPGGAVVEIYDAAGVGLEHGHAVALSGAGPASETVGVGDLEVGVGNVDALGEIHGDGWQGIPGKDVTGAHLVQIHMRYARHIVVLNL